MNTFIKQIVAAKTFHHAIVAVIVLAGVVAGLETSTTLMARHGALLHALDRLILGVFIVEALLKMAAHGRQPWRYFADGWNVFDFLIIVICVLPVGGPFAAVLRLARALRLLRLVSALPKLQLLVGALLKSLSAMGYVSLLLALLFYIYAVAGIHMFGAHDPKNFGSLPVAFLSLFRLVTLDNWADLFSAQLPHVHGIKVAIYFVTFIVFGTMIILNLFIGIIMNSMSEMHAEIAEQDRALHERETGAATLEDDLRSLEQELKETQTRMAGLRRKWASPGAPIAGRRKPEEIAA
ncbi:MAG: ion transporter [Verrucomicrobia bacterium]|nr:ion transporter [Verrucomicrobiota bacterium]